MKDISDVVNNRKCTGCEACVNICSKGAIKMQRDKEGFLVPVVNESKCVKCGLCNKVCPMINEVSRSTQFPVPKVYAGWNRNEAVRMQSSSGGVFSVLANFVLSKKGFVYGAGFDSNNRLRHMIVSKQKDLSKLRGSKYVQSEIGDAYKKIRTILEKGKWVLFVGTPCQAAGLKNFLQRDYRNLLVVDIICHGVPSPLVFEKYIKEVEKKYNKRIDRVEFRNKSAGWKKPNFVLTSSNKNILVKDILFNDVYGRGFLTNLYLRPICTSCIYTKIPKVSDITLGDFWGISKYKENLDDDKGTSLILLNNEKGLSAFNKIKNKLSVFSNVPINVAFNNNYPVIIPSDSHVNRESFFSEFEGYGKNISQLILKYLDDGNYGIRSNGRSVGVLNFHYENFNFGANLVSYALNKTIGDLGFEVRNINYVPFDDQIIEDKVCSINFYKFRQRFLPMTKICRSDIDLLKLNNQFGTFIVGSDQVWRQIITGDNVLHYFFDFVNSSKNIFSYGASFGHNSWEGDEATTQKVSNLLRRFRSVSVRERDGVDILFDKFGVDKAVCVLDPTLLLSKKDYEDLIASEVQKPVPKKYVAYYFIFDNDGVVEHGEKMKEILSYLDCTLVNIRGGEQVVVGKNKFIYNSIPAWLNYIKHSNFVITDSYHGVIFSIVFKKNFICIGKKSKAISRFESLFSLFGIKDRFFASLDDVNDMSVLLRDIDYKKVYEKLDVEIKKSLKFLKENLGVSRSDKKIVEVLDREWIDVKINELEMKSQNNILYVKSQELESQNQLMHTKSQELESQNQLMHTKSQELESQEQALLAKSKELELGILAYQNTKTFRYANKMKKLLLKIGVKKFKL